MTTRVKVINNPELGIMIQQPKRPFGPKDSNTIDFQVKIKGNGKKLKDPFEPELEITVINGDDVMYDCGTSTHRGVFGFTNSAVCHVHIDDISRYMAKRNRDITIVLSVFADYPKGYYPAGYGASGSLNAVNGGTSYAGKGVNDARYNRNNGRAPTNGSIYPTST